MQDISGHGANFSFGWPFLKLAPTDYEYLQKNVYIVPLNKYIFQMYVSVTKRKQMSSILK